MSWTKGLPTAGELEERFTTFVSTQGGERVADLLSKTRDLPLNADYLLWDRSVVAELKTITADHYTDPKIGEKLGKLHRQWVQQGLLPKAPPGRSRWNTGMLPVREQRRAVDVLAAPIKAAVDHASRQIRKTKEVLGLHQAKGLLILANLGDQSLTPQVAFTYLNYVLARHKRTFHSFIFFSPTFDPKRPNKRAAVWMSGRTANPEGGVSDDLLDRLGHGWHDFVNEGHPVPWLDLPPEVLMGKAPRN